MEDRDKQLLEKATYTEQVASIPVIHETIRLDSKVVETGSVRVIKEVHEETIRVPLLSRQDEYHVERVSINRYVDEPPPTVRHEGDTTIFTVVVEEAVIQKRLKVVEEVRITASTKETAWEENITLRKEDVTIERQTSTSDKQS